MKLDAIFMSRKKEKIIFGPGRGSRLYEIRAFKNVFYRAKRLNMYLCVIYIR